MDVSIVVSTRDRMEDLARLLASLDAVAVRPGIEWELVLVDNNSSDGTAELAREFSRKAGFPIRYAFEARQGKSHGLNTGLAIATGRILAFTDDDAIVPPDWVQQIIDFFEANPAAACVGGMVRLHDARDAPQSVRLSPDPRIIGMADFVVKYIPVIGCNMAIRADLLRRVGEFDTDLCPGSRIGVADDVDMLYRVLRAGQQVYYAPRICLGHNHGRRTPEQLAKVRRGYLTGRGAFYCKYCLRGDRAVAYWAYRECRSFVHHVLGARAREVAVEMSWMILGALRYIRFHRWVGDRRFRPAAAGAASFSEPMSNPTRPRQP